MFKYEHLFEIAMSMAQFIRSGIPRAMDKLNEAKEKKEHGDVIIGSFGGNQENPHVGIVLIVEDERALQHILTPEILESYRNAKDGWTLSQMPGDRMGQA